MFKQKSSVSHGDTGIKTGRHLPMVFSYIRRYKNFLKLPNVLEYSPHHPQAGWIKINYYYLNEIDLNQDLDF